MLSQYAHLVKCMHIKVGDQKIDLELSENGVRMIRKQVKPINSGKWLGRTYPGRAKTLNPTIPGCRQGGWR